MVCECRCTSSRTVGSVCSSRAPSRMNPTRRAAQLGIGVRGGGQDGVLGAGPQRPRPGADGGVLEQLLLEVLDLRGGVRVGAQGVHVGPQPGVVGAAQLVPGVAADLGQEALQAGEDAVEHPVVHPVGHPRRARRRRAGRGRPAGCPRRKRASPRSAGRQHLLVAVALDDQFQHPGHRRGGRRRVQLAVDQGGDRRLEVLVAEQFGEGGEHGAGVAGQPLGATGGGEEGAEPAGHVDRAQLLLDHGRGSGSSPGRRCRGWRRSGPSCAG